MTVKMGFRYEIFRRLSVPPVPVPDQTETQLWIPEESVWLIPVEADFIRHIGMVHGLVMLNFCTEIIQVGIYFITQMTKIRKKCNF